MLAKVFAFASALAAFAAFGQTPSPQVVERTFTFACIDTPTGRQGMTDVLRFILQVPQGEIQLGEKSLVFRGTTAAADAAEWLFHEIDRPPAGQASTREYRMPQAPDDVIHVYALSGEWTPQDMQETVNAVRSIVELQRVAALGPAQTLVARGPVNRIVAADWVVRAFGESPEKMPASDFVMTGPLPLPETLANVTHLLPMSRALSPQQVMEATDAIRSLAELMRVVYDTRAHVIAVRGSAEQIAFADWLSARIAQAPGDLSTPQYSFGDRGVNAVRVIYQAQGAGPQSLQDLAGIVRSTGIQRVATWTAPTKAVAFRGTEAQAVEAERLIRQRQTALAK